MEKKTKHCSREDRLLHAVFLLPVLSIHSFITKYARKTNLMAALKLWIQMKAMVWYFRPNKEIINASKVAIN